MDGLLENRSDGNVERLRESHLAELNAVHALSIALESLGRRLPAVDEALREAGRARMTTVSVQP